MKNVKATERVGDLESRDCVRECVYASVEVGERTEIRQAIWILGHK